MTKKKPATKKPAAKKSTPMMRKGGVKKYNVGGRAGAPTTSKPNPNKSSEFRGMSEKQKTDRASSEFQELGSRTVLRKDNINYEKSILELPGGKGKLFVEKDGKMNVFNLDDPKAIANQKAIMKREAGYNRNGGKTGPKKKKVVVMRKGGKKK